MSIRLTVNAGEHDRIHCPVSTRITAVDMDPQRVVMRDESSGEQIPCQAERCGDTIQLSWILPLLPAKATRRFVVEAGEPVTNGVALDAADGRIDIAIAGEHFTSYHFGPKWSRPFLHPVIGPHGDPITRGYPVQDNLPGETQDHPHHKSFWVAWGDVNGTDNWSENQERGHAKQVQRELPEASSGPVFATIRTRNDWVSEAGEKVLEEARTLKVYNLPAACRLVDLNVEFRATNGPVTFGDTKEGGICSIRVATSMDAKEHGVIVNAYGGTNEAETWGKRAPWCDYYGPVNGKTVGICIFDNPANFRHPTYWHVRNYGLMTANPFGLSHFLKNKEIDGSHTLGAGETLAFQYRVLFHAGDTKTAAVAERYHDYINPPGISQE
ncbi:MAG: PmoA family protein [Lentisphaeria bacterium]|nr:PmoA family protein [Lentisphaeria bacterium]